MLLTLSSTSGTFWANLSSTRITPSDVTRTATSPASWSSPSSTPVAPHPLGAHALKGPLTTYRLSLTFSIRIASGTSPCSVIAAKSATPATTEPPTSHLKFIASSFHHAGHRGHGGKILFPKD